MAQNFPSFRLVLRIVQETSMATIRLFLDTSRYIRELLVTSGANSMNLPILFHAGLLAMCFVISSVSLALNILLPWIFQRTLLFLSRSPFLIISHASLALEASTSTMFSLACVYVILYVFIIYQW